MASREDRLFTSVTWLCLRSRFHFSTYVLAERRSRRNTFKFAPAFIVAKIFRITMLRRSQSKTRTNSKKYPIRISCIGHVSATLTYSQHLLLSSTCRVNVTIFTLRTWEWHHFHNVDYAPSSCYRVIAHTYDKRKRSASAIATYRNRRIRFHRCYFRNSYDCRTISARYQCQFCIDN